MLTPVCVRVHMLACVCMPLSTYFFLQVQSLPKPFPIPVFRGATEANLEKKLLVDTDRKYMVQVLSTVDFPPLERKPLHCHACTVHK